jgi:hypothetical protein
MRFSVLKTILTLGLCLGALLIAEAQNPISNRIRNRVNQRINREVDRAVDKAIDEALSPEEKADSIARAQAAHDSTAQPTVTMSSGEWEPYENPYPLSFDMTITSSKRNREETSQVEYVMDTWRTGMRIVQEDGTSMRLIMDNQAGTVTTVMEENGAATQAFRMRQRKFDLSDAMPDEEDFTITRTGNTRTINGYDCEEYIIEHEEGTTTAWVTNDIDMDYSMMIAAIGAQARGNQTPATGGNVYGVEGFPIESTMVSKNGRETTTSSISNIKTGDDINRAILNLEGVEVMSLGF